MVGWVRAGVRVVGVGHDSVIYSRLERPADSVHLHARSVPANLGRRVLRAYGPTHAQSVWASLTFKVCGPRATFQMHWPMGFHISAWAGTPLQAAWPVHIYIWMFGSNGQK